MNSYLRYKVIISSSTSGAKKSETIRPARTGIQAQLFFYGAMEKNQHVIMYGTNADHDGENCSWIELAKHIPEDSLTRT